MTELACITLAIIVAAALTRWAWRATRREQAEPITVRRPYYRTIPWRVRK